MKWFRFRGLWGEKGWTEPAYVEIDDNGIIRRVMARGDDAESEAVNGWALPGVPNSHSHAFQYAMAGLTEHLPAGRSGDDFWSWRETMYELALSITPEQLVPIAAQLYAEMLRLGFTSVAEFHYLHHRPDGSPYPQGTALAEALCEAASMSGIRLTLVPVHYRMKDFGESASARQRRFLFASADAYLNHAEKCATMAKRFGFSMGGGVHSLRASPPEDSLRILRDLPKDWPRHLHIAEQTKEVDSCLRALGRRPVEWLLENIAIDSRFHLVHATHCTLQEAQGLARAGAHVVLCPTTEANLGDGIFPLEEYWKAGGRISIGTDSQVGLDPWEELRWADYVQRLRLERRNPLCGPGEDSGESLLRSAVQTGGRATGRPTGSFLGPGDPLDAVIVDAKDPFWEGLPASRRIATRIFAPASRPLLGTLVGGRWVARDGRHLKADALMRGLREAKLRQQKEQSN